MPYCDRRTTSSLSISSLLTAMAVVLLSGMAISANAANETSMAPAAFVADEGCAPAPVALPKASPSSVPVLDHSCWINYRDAEKLVPLWVDVRPLPETRVAPLPGALQIPLHQVFTKTFLKETPAVLIGNGVDDAEMAMACRQLKDAGLAQTRILRHGVRAWYRAGQSLPGHAETIMALDTIGAEYFHRGQIAQAWRVVGVNLPEEALASYAVNAKTPDQAVGQIRSLIRRWADTQTSTYAPTTVIVAADEAATQQLRQQWRALFGALSDDVLWLADGWSGYVAFVEQQQRVAAIAANPPPLRRPCGS